MTLTLDVRRDVVETDANPVVALEDLVVDYVTRVRTTRAVDGVSLSIGTGEIVGLAGESGCGKSTLGNAVMQVLRPPARISGGRVLFEGKDVAGQSRRELRRYRWRNVSMVFQSAMNSLNPGMRVGDQYVDMMRAH
jgi:peptide/nickel transport system ATP-binding protein